MREHKTKQQKVKVHESGSGKAIREKKRTVGKKGAERKGSKTVRKKGLEFQSCPFPSSSLPTCRTPTKFLLKQPDSVANSREPLRHQRRLDQKISPVTEIRLISKA